jgi:hypothetical protein
MRTPVLPTQGSPNYIKPLKQEESMGTLDPAVDAGGQPAARGFQNDSYKKRWPQRERRKSRERTASHDSQTETLSDVLNRLSDWYQSSFINQTVEHIGRALEESKFANTRKGTLLRRAGGRRPSREEVAL